jgi:ABC-type dipeptide/oligopeptide/nickel transport system permease component/ABC-type transport system substrate-binding protein
MLLRTLKISLALGLAAAGYYGSLWLGGRVLRPELATEPVQHPAEALAAVEALRDLSFDPAHPPTIWREVDYSEGPVAAWWPKGESPVLAELVAEGALPPVAERVGPEPIVLEGEDGIGTYGGTWLRVANQPGDIGTITWRLSGATLARWSPMGYPIVPHIARGWDRSEDAREWTVYLRRGVRWSDGHPFTADDIMFWWEKQVNLLDADLPPPHWMRVRGEAGHIVKVDDYTVRFVFPHPYGTFLEALARQNFYAVPRHYMEQFHPLLGRDELIEAAMRSMRIPTRRGLYNTMGSWNNPAHPRLWPWVLRTHRSNPPISFVRNPYYPAVDPAGNQLPYVDRIMFEVRTNKLIPNVAASGALTMQDRFIRFDDYTLLMSERERNGFEVYHWFPSLRSMWAIFPNLNKNVAPDDHVGQLKLALLNKRDFRIALSVALNRRGIIDAEYSGVGEPAQLSPGRESPYFNERLHTSWTQHDPALANRLLDGLGLTQRDFEGMRTFADGTRMTWNIDYTEFTGPGPVQFVVDDWARVGIRAVPRERSRPLFTVEKMARLHDFTIWTGEGEFDPIVEPRSFVPVNTESHQAQGWGKWYQDGGLYGAEHATRYGGIPVPDDHPYRRTMEVLEEALATADLEERVRLFQEVLEINADEIFTINIATPPPQLAVVQQGFRNVPRLALAGAPYSTPANAGLETYFFERPVDSPGAIAQLKREMVEVTPAPQAVDVGTLERASGSRLGALLNFLFWGSVAAGTVLLGVRHPYVGRRLLIMIPTLLVISIATFIIIQAPPGDFIQSKIVQANLTGDPTHINEVAEIREVFPIDQPYWVQYARWMGLPWFLTFDRRDTGLLQGNLGRSMETRRPVNEIVGDRILLTVVVSVATILFTWAVALPIGIYSAVRQYSIGDYLLTFVGFIGMCVPNFLLALVLMYWADQYLGIKITGLFSPEFATQPEWSWAKVVDLMKHIWVPVVVLGTAGTAGMIRVMRGNLLDELRKPYVTTARAKGVRPLRLLVKYPVRLALNPFISAIGGLFPQIVSGGAIVALVLSLPMVGPLMLEALLTEDMYLAGSMLMVLSLLGVFGTLVSDLLLLWLDPRIRMEGGSK